MADAALSTLPWEEKHVPFQYFADLIQRFSKVKPRRAANKGPCTTVQHPQVFQSWVENLKRPIVPGTGAIIFRLLFPAEDEDRKYDMKETKLSRALANALVVNASEGCRGYQLVTWKETADGCLGQAVADVVQETYYNGGGYPTSPTLHEVDRLLDELALTSQWTKHTTPKPAAKRPVELILRDLYINLTPYAASVMTQIILKDLSPLLYSRTSESTSSTLLEFNSTAYAGFTKEIAMRAWDPLMPQLYKTHSKLGVAANAVERLTSGISLLSPGATARALFTPTLGIPVEIPKCVKGRSCPMVLERLNACDRLYAETKYDGERMQIHLDFSLPKHKQIQIFSKSKRDSTKDRIATHDIIRAALGQETSKHAHEKLAERLQRVPPQPSTATSLILEAEMVAYSEETSCIEEFWRIRSLVGATASGPRRIPNRPSHGNLNFLPSDSEDEVGTPDRESQDSLASDGTANNTRHFMLVFFDVLFLDGVGLLHEPYEKRRTQLEQLIRPIPGFSQISQSTVVHMGAGGQHALETLHRIFSEATANHEEGLVVKGAESSYNDSRMPWIKVKRDYIPGLGDTLDFVVLGASWSKERGRELRVGPDVLTTFYVGCVTNLTDVKGSRSVRPHFEVFFTVEYGLSREQLEDFNAQIQCTGLLPYKPEKMQGLPYTCNLLKGLPLPTSMLSRPILVELMGAGFSKAPGSRSYELRFPRITKVWRREERDWRQGTCLEELHKVACESIGRATADKKARDAASMAWGAIPSPGPKSTPKKRARAEDMMHLLGEKDSGWQRKRTKTGYGKSPAFGRLKSVTNLMSAPPPDATSLNEAGYAASGTPLKPMLPAANRPSAPRTPVSPRRHKKVASENLPPAQVRLLPKASGQFPRTGPGASSSGEISAGRVGVAQRMDCSEPRSGAPDFEVTAVSSWSPVSRRTTAMLPDLTHSPTSSESFLVTPPRPATTSNAVSCIPLGLPSAEAILPEPGLLPLPLSPNPLSKARDVSSDVSLDGVQLDVPAIPDLHRPMPPNSLSMCGDELSSDTVMDDAETALDARIELERAALHKLCPVPHLSSKLNDACVWMALGAPASTALNGVISRVVPYMSRLHTPEAFFLAAGWSASRKLPIRAQYTRGVIFAEDAALSDVLEVVKRMQVELDRQAVDVRLRILICSLAELHACDASPDHVIEPIWISG